MVEKKTYWIILEKRDENACWNIIYRYENETKARERFKERKTVATAFKRIIKLIKRTVVWEHEDEELDCWG